MWRRDSLDVPAGWEWNPRQVKLRFADAPGLPSEIKKEKKKIIFPSLPYCEQIKTSCFYMLPHSLWDINWGALMLVGTAMGGATPNAPIWTLTKQRWRKLCWLLMLIYIFFSFFCLFGWRLQGNNLSYCFPWQRKQDDCRRQRRRHGERAAAATATAFYLALRKRTEKKRGLKMHGWILWHKLPKVETTKGDRLCVCLCVRSFCSRSCSVVKSYRLYRRLNETETLLAQLK